MIKQVKILTVFFVIITLVTIFSACADDTAITIYGEDTSPTTESIKPSSDNAKDQTKVTTFTIIETEKITEELITDKAEPQTEYLLNTNTKKFHRPSCKSGQKTKEINRAYHTGTREEVIAKGYSPCKICNP